MKALLPKIKFKNFDEKWNRKKLHSIAPLRGGFAFKSEKFQNTGIPIVRISNIKFDGTVGGEFEYYSKINSDEKFVLRGRSILLAMSGATTGKIAMLDSEEEYYQNQRVGYFQTTGEVDYDFLSSVLQTKAFTNQLNAVLVAGAQPNISSKEIDSFEFYIPDSIDEQSVIGSLFHTLDDLLASYKDNLANYQVLKATMLSKMFPKAGQTVPEIRLDGFEGEWEVVNLGTLIENYDEIISGVSGFPIATSSRKGLYLQNDYFEGGRTGIDLTLDFHRVPMGYVTYRHMSDDSIFKFNKNNFETDVLVSKEYPVFMSNDSSNIDFILYHLNNSRLFLRFSTMQKLGGTRVRLYYKNLITYKLAVPTIKEQQAIGSYFSNLDNLINSQQEKISQLETLKKKLFQDMFV